MPDDPEAEALLDKLYEEFVRGAGNVREKFKSKVRAYHAIQLAKLLLSADASNEEEPRWFDIFLNRRD